MKEMGDSLAPKSLAAERVQIHLDLLPAAQHPDGGKEAPARHHSILLADNLPITCEEHLGGGGQEKVRSFRFASPNSF